MRIWATASGAAARSRGHDAFCGGGLSLGRRSSATAEAERVEGFRKEEIRRWAPCHLQPRSTVVSGRLSCFEGIRTARCERQSIITGGERKVTEKQSSTG